MNLVDILIRILLVSASLVFVLAKCLFLFRYRLGFAMVLSNIVYETARKRIGVERLYIDVILFVFLILGWSVFFSWPAGAGFSMIAALAWISAFQLDSKWRSGILAHQHQKLHQRIPMPVPDLISLITGPVVERNKQWMLGDWPLGHEAAYSLIVINPSRVRPQFPLRIDFYCLSQVLEIRKPAELDVKCPEPGGCIVFPFSIKAVQTTGTPADIQVKLIHADIETVYHLKVNSVIAPEKLRIQHVEITRWKGGARAAFAWRGDQDLYDPATFQSAEGLQSSLGLSMRFRIPSSLYLSARLSLVRSEHEAFCNHFGWDRHPEEIPDFISFLKNDVLMCQELEFPMSGVEKPAMELGNHSYLHYGTHTAADSANNWTGRVWVGAGRYPWLSTDAPDSFTEQRDNIIKGARVIRDTLGVETSSWASPGRVFDSHTARAVEAAGIEIGSDTNATTFRSVLQLVKPHHPPGCRHLVEMTKKFPGDPEDGYMSAVLKYWLHASLRAKTAFVFMAHHHLLQYRSTACYRITEEFLDHVLREGRGDFFCGTITSLGRYWRDVLSPASKCVSIKSTERCITIQNSGRRNLKQVPVEIEFDERRRIVILVDIDAGSATAVLDIDRIEST